MKTIMRIKVCGLIKHASEASIWLHIPAFLTTTYSSSIDVIMIEWKEFVLLGGSHIFLIPFWCPLISMSVVHTLVDKFFIPYDTRSAIPVKTHYS